MNVTKNWNYQLHWFHRDVINQKDKLGLRLSLYVSEVLNCWWHWWCLTAKYIFLKKELREMIPKRFSQLKIICKWSPFQQKMIRWESDWRLYNKTLMKCFSVSLVSQQDLFKSTMTCSSRSVLPGRICSSPLWRCSSRSVLPAGYAQVHYDPVLLVLLRAGYAQFHYDAVLLDLCYLQDQLKSTMTLFF